MANDLELTHTAYSSGPNGLWTVWDHMNDQEVASDLDEAAALDLVPRLRGE